MDAQQMNDHWMPMEFHGVIPYPTDGHIEKAVRQALKDNLPKSFRHLSFSRLKFLVVTAADSTQQIVFEVLE